MSPSELAGTDRRSTHLLRRESWGIRVEKGQFIPNFLRGHGRNFQLFVGFGLSRHWGQISRRREQAVCLRE